MKLKPLVWEGKDWETHASFYAKVLQHPYMYKIHKTNETSVHLYLEDGFYYDMDEWILLESFTSVDQAKAAAQEHLEKQLREQLYET